MVAALEAILFASGEPIAYDRLKDVFECSEDELEAALQELKQRYIDTGSGIELLKLGDSYQLSTAKEYYEYIKKAYDIRRRTPLSQAALEVLAVIAYNQPVTKAFVEQVRGVDCSGVISTLVEKELIEERGRLELPGRPLLYGTTKVFMRCFSLSELTDLPRLPHEEKATMPDIAEQLPIDEEQAE